MRVFRFLLLVGGGQEEVSTILERKIMAVRNRYIKNEKIKKRRRNLRLIPTKAEYVLWQELRRKYLKYKFRRQVSIGKFIVDFYCHELKLVIEIDGPVHKEQIEYDEERENWLRQQGYSLIRFLNDEVLFEREIVLQCIEDCCYVIAESRS